MPVVNCATRETTCTAGCCGPGRRGKTTSLQDAHARVPRERKGALASLATETDRTLFFHVLPPVLGSKRDLPHVLPVDELEALLSVRGNPGVEAGAVTGRGVFATHRRVSGLVLRRLPDRLGAPVGA